MAQLTHAKMCAAALLTLAALLPLCSPFSTVHNSPKLSHLGWRPSSKTQPVATGLAKHTSILLAPLHQYSRGNKCGQSALFAESSDNDSSSSTPEKDNVDVTGAVTDSFISSEGDTESDPTHHSLAPSDVSYYHASDPNNKATSARGWKFWNKKGEAEDGVTFSQKLRKMGMSVLLSYGFVSNMSYCVTVSLAWYIFNKRTGLSPLAAGQWPKFLAVYAGFYVFNGIIRPARLTLAVVVGRYFDAAVLTLQNKFNCRKGVAIAMLVFLANIVGTCSFMALGIYLASVASGVPIRAVAVLAK